DLQNIVLQEYWKPSLCCFSYEVFKLSITFGNTGRVSFEEKLFLLEDKPDSRSVAFMTIDRTREWSTNHGGVVLSVTDLCQGCHVRRRKHIVLTMREKTKKRFNAGLKGLVAGIKPREFKCRKMTQTPGGFEAFQSCFPYLCETQDKSKCPTIAQLSQPCLPITSVGPTKVLSHLYLGSQQDVLDENLLQKNGINYVLNISKTCPAPSYIPANHFLRIPVKDNYGETILSWLDDAIQFIDKVKSANGKVIVHCLAGISRSPTVAIAYIMKRLNMTNETAYRFVKAKRPTISPNFNFLGQLIEYEKLLQKPMLSLEPECSVSVSVTSSCQVTYATTPTQEDTTEGGRRDDRGEEEDEDAENNSEIMETSSSSSPENSKQENSHRKIAQPRSRSKSPRPSQGKSLPKVTLSDLSSSSTSGPSKSYKRSMSEKDTAKLSLATVSNVDKGSSLPNISQSGGCSIPRPAGLSLKVVSHHEPASLAFPERTDSKKPRSGCTTPVGVGVLEWGTSNLSMNSPKAGSGNPFVDACERFQAQSRMKVEEKLLVSPSRGGEDGQKLPQEETVTKHSAPLKKGASVEYSTHQGNVQQSNHAKEKQRLSPGKSILKKSAKLDLNAQPGSNSPSQDQRDPFSPGSISKHASKVQKGVLRSLPQHLKLRIKVSPSRQESSPPGHLTSTCIPLVRQGSGQSLCSESSASSGISPNLESDTSSLLDRHSSISSGISPDFPSSILDSSGSPSKAAPVYPSTLEIQKGWNPFRFPSKQGEDSPSDGAGESVWQKRPESSDSLSSGSTSSPKLGHQSPATAMDRGMRYFTRCKFDPDERRDSCDSILSTHHQKKCNSDRNTKVLSVRSQSCEEISSCAREAVVSEMVRSSRENLLQYGLTRFDDEDYETCSLSSERSLSSSCEMIEVS
ncbi:hypothetical protein BSL78_13853, partial [Apostichopus japonicus]